MTAGRVMLTAPARLEREVRKSLFLAQAAPVASPAEALAFVRAVGIADATHNCWAYRIGQDYRSDDDGEPGGTAGRPILQVIDGQGFDRTVVVVTRWFGGIKLGAGGLVRAYGGTAAECLRLAPRLPIVPMTRLALHCGFADLALLRARLGALDATVEDEAFDATGAALVIAVPDDRMTEAVARITDLTRGQSMPRVVDDEAT
ncbi:YigZ family protein [Gluconacetobacter azotocaptans]|uniref:IMPACT family protein n=1 Tax=Gluconacetobacter azotocaptans TaxID=142834 RepID=UPI00195D95C3|nr:YigZ family protein [Gluconacetobacter azotocaptans]MBM9402608.1 YigZ family protein [Gluconacetobacter azotocaptans]